MKADATDYDPGDEVQEVIDALLADEDFMASLDRLIDDADQKQEWMATVIEEDDAGGFWKTCLGWVGIEVRIYEQAPEHSSIDDSAIQPTR